MRRRRVGGWKSWTWLSRRLANNLRRSRRLLHWWRWPAIVLAIAFLLSPVALAIATPALAAMPAPSARQWAPPPLPTPLPDARASLDGLVDPLPIVVRDLPDQASRLAAARYDGVTLHNPQAAIDMFDAAYYGLVVPPADRETVSQFAALLIYANEPIWEWDRSKRRSTGADPIVTAALASLAKDPGNADRLSNLAVALFALGVSNRQGTPVTKLRNGPVNNPDNLQSTAWKLLAAANQTFPSNRAVRLNLAFFDSLSSLNGPPPAIVDLAPQLATYPGDRTARLLLGSLEARQPGAAGGLDLAVATLRPLTDDPATAALGHAALGDAYLARAQLQRADSPFTARDLAGRALTEYDFALATSTDPGLYAGRANALDFLGASADAVAAQRRAVELAPRSVDFRLGLALLQEKVGDYAGMRESSRTAVALDLDAPDLAVSRLRFLLLNVGADTDNRLLDRGYQGWSFGSDRPHLGISFLTSGGGTFIVSADLIPRTHDVNADEQRRLGTARDEAATTAVAASTLLKDPLGAAADVERWKQRGLDVNKVANGFVGAAYLAAGQPVPEGTTMQAALFYAQEILRHTGRFADAAEICRRVADAPSTDGSTRLDALLWAGESSYLAGDYKTAETRLEGVLDTFEHDPTVVVGLDLRSNSPEPDWLLEAGAAAEAAGDTTIARQVDALASSDAVAPARIHLVGLAKLGDLDLVAGDTGGAIGQYDLAFGSLATVGLGPAIGTSWRAPLDGAFKNGMHPDVQTRTMLPRLYTNRGIARLRLAQPAPDVPPDCVKNRTLCQGARDDFAAAVASDPQNPNYQLNAGWAARLLGDTATARQDLAAAAAADPTTSPAVVPALNDLGVLAAQSGDSSGARVDFEGALAISPTYNLAAWNLGVLAMQQGVTGVPRGQAYLARAIMQTPGWWNQSVQYRTDERVYRVTVGPSGADDGSRTLGHSYTLVTLAFSSVVVLAASGPVLGVQIASKSVETAVELGRTYLPKLGDVLSSRLGIGALLPDWLSGILPWLLTLPALAIATAAPAWTSTSNARVATVAVALFAIALAVVAHELGHLLGGRLLEAKVQPAHWGTGIVVTLLLLPVQLLGIVPIKVTGGPLVGHRVEASTPSRTWWASFSGSFANLILALLTFGLFQLQPAPLLQLIAQVQLAAVSFSLLPFAPMDGHGLVEGHHLAMTFIGLLVAVIAIVVAQGRL